MYCLHGHGHGKDWCLSAMGEVKPSLHEAQRDGKTSSDLNVNVDSVCKRMSAIAFSPSFFIPIPRCLLLPIEAAPTELS